MRDAEAVRPGRKLSKHDRLVESLRARVRLLPVGAGLPAERVLAAEFGVARMTIRQALDVLERHGEVERRRGAGTFKARPKLNHQVKILSFTEDMERIGLRPSTVTLDGGRQLAGERLGAKLRISPDDFIWHFRRLRMADNEPMAIESVSIPEYLVSGAQSEDFQVDSLYRMLQDQFGISPVGGRQRMEATSTRAEEARLLEVPVRAPALFVDRVVWGVDGRVIEHASAVYRGDRYAFVASLQLDD